MAYRHIVLVCAIANSALAATATTTPTASTTSIFLPGFDQQSLVASVITAAPSATTYFVQCGSNDQLECGIQDGMTVTAGPSTFGLSVNSTDLTISEACALTSDIAYCTYSLGDGSSGSESVSGLQSMYMNVTITAGFAALASASSEAAAQIAAETAEVTAMAYSPTASSASATETATTSVVTNGLGSAGTIVPRWSSGRVSLVFGVVATLLSW